MHGSLKLQNVFFDIFTSHHRICDIGIMAFNRTAFVMKILFGLDLLPVKICIPWEMIFCQRTHRTLTLLTTKMMTSPLLPALLM